MAAVMKNVSPMDALTPWRELLPSIGKLYRPLDDEGDRYVDADGLLWFHWTPARDPLAWPRQLELVQLLALLVDVDRAAFEMLLGGFEDAYSHYFVVYRSKYEAPYSLGLYVTLEDDSDHNSILDALKMELREDPESEFVKAKRALVGDHAVKTMPVFVEVMPSVEFLDTSLQFVIELVQFQLQPESNTLFQVTAVQVSNDTRDAGGDPALWALARLADLGVCIPRVVIQTSATLSTPPQDIVAFVAAIQSLLGVRGVATQAPIAGTPQTRRRLQHLELRPPFSMHIVIALCTAIAQSETLQRVSVEEATARSHRQPFPIEPFWRWLAYALFSRGANSNVAMLELDAGMLLRFYVQGMHSVAHHEDALVSELDPRLPIPSPWNNWVVDIPRDMEIALVYDYGGGKEVVASTTHATGLKALRILHDDEDGWLYVVLPGWGECRVASDSVNPRFVQPTPEPDAPPHDSPRGVHHLRLNYATAGTLVAVETFLDVAGAHVRRLEIHEPESVDDNIGTVLLGDALRRCPHVEELDLFAVDLTDLDMLTDAAFINTPRIKKIKLRQLTVRSMRSVHRFFDALADPEHPVLKNLHELSFHIIERTIEDQTRGSIFNSCVRMLQSNTTLRECRAITLSKQRAAKFSDKFRAFDGQRLPARKAPLALQSKLAFLAVVTEAEAANSALHRLDVNLLENVFELAAENEIRASSVEVAVTYEHSTGGGAANAEQQ